MPQFCFTTDRSQSKHQMLVLVNQNNPRITRAPAVLCAKMRIAVDTAQRLLLGPKKEVDKVLSVHTMLVQYRSTLYAGSYYSIRHCHRPVQFTPWHDEALIRSSACHALPAYIAQAQHIPSQASAASTMHKVHVLPYQDRHRYRLVVLPLIANQPRVLPMNQPWRF
jgi:hypothetical protein